MSSTSLREETSRLYLLSEQILASIAQTPPTDTGFTAALTNKHNQQASHHICKWNQHLLLPSCQGHDHSSPSTRRQGAGSRGRADPGKGAVGAGPAPGQQDPPRAQHRGPPPPWSSRPHPSAFQSHCIREPGARRGDALYLHT